MGSPHGPSDSCPSLPHLPRVQSRGTGTPAPVMHEHCPELFTCTDITEAGPTAIINLLEGETEALGLRSGPKIPGSEEV